MKVSVVICTWNRAQLLDRTLQQMHYLQAPPEVEWELLIVNNSSTDRTDEIIRSHSAVLPIRRLFEARPGKSFAANLALSEASGELILWTDDDVLVQPDWMAQYVLASRQWPDAAYFGGSIEPSFEVEPPVWIREHLVHGGPYADLDLGPEIRRFRSEESPLGANMAVRAPYLKSLPFNERLGVFVGQYLPAEDGDLFVRMKQKGLAGVWVGTARVRHIIGAERMTKRYVWNWYRGHGRTLVIRGEGGNVATIFGVPRWAVRVFIQSGILVGFLYPLPGKTWVRAYKQCARALGIMQQSRDMIRQKNRDLMSPSTELH